MEVKQRVIAAVAHEFPGAKVVFSDDPGDMVRFKIVDADDGPISRGYQHYKPAEIEGWTDERFREIIRFLCGWPKRYSLSS